LREVVKDSMKQANGIKNYEKEQNSVLKNIKDIKDG
jgi:hypothetical protein